MRKIVLASGSPRRKELLAQIGVSFDVIVSSCEEVITKTEPSEVVKELSFQKAEDVAKRISALSGEEYIVIGSDTVVCQNGQIMGKPKDDAEAFEMIQSLQGNVHSVFTGVTLYYVNGQKKNPVVFACETKVHVYPMTPAEIDAYIKTGESRDKAGAYGIQGRFAAYVSHIEGDYNNVVGLPVGAVWQQLKL